MLNCLNWISLSHLLWSCSRAVFAYIMLSGRLTSLMLVFQYHSSGQLSRPRQVVGADEGEENREPSPTVGTLVLSV